MKEVAFQAGVSLATVDRVLNARPGVSQATVHKVNQAIKEFVDSVQGEDIIGELALDLVVERGLLILGALEEEVVKDVLTITIFTQMAMLGKLISLPYL